jgi:hypothetical protein
MDAFSKEVSTPALTGTRAEKKEKNLIVKRKQDLY